MLNISLGIESDCNCYHFLKIFSSMASLILRFLRLFTMTMSLNVVKENWIKLKKGQSIVMVKGKFSVMLQKIAMSVISNKKVAHEFELCHENVIWQFWTLVKVGSIGKKDATISNARIFSSACCLYVILFDELHTKKANLGGTTFCWLHIFSFVSL